MEPSAQAQLLRNGPVADGSQAFDFPRNHITELTGGQFGSFGENGQKREEMGHPGGESVRIFRLKWRGTAPFFGLIMLERKSLGFLLAEGKGRISETFSDSVAWPLAKSLKVISVGGRDGANHNIKRTQRRSVTLGAHASVIVTVPPPLKHAKYHSP